MQERDTNPTNHEKGRKAKPPETTSELVHNFSGQPITIKIGGETHKLSSMWFIEKVTPKDPAKD